MICAANVPVWVKDYVGIPFVAHGRAKDGADCWGLVRIILHDQFGIMLPIYADGYEDTSDRQGMARTIQSACVSGPFVRLDEATQTQAGDIIVLRLRGVPLHVGVVAGDGIMLHVHAGTDACLEDYTTQKWCHAVLGFYRPKSLLT